MDGYRPKIEVRRDERDHAFAAERPHALYVDGGFMWWLIPESADAWEQYAADAEVGARLRTATGDGVRAEQDPKIPLRVRLSGDETDGHWYVWFHTEADALAFIAQVNGVSVGGDVPSDPSTEGMLVRSGQWLIDNDPDGQTWERWAAPDWWRCAIDLEDSPRPEFIYIVRRIVPSPAPPEPENVPWFLALGRKVDGSPERIVEVGCDDAAGPWVRFGSPLGARMNVAAMFPDAPDGTVTVLRDPSTSPASPASSQGQDS
jgi:hypothetical protein